MIYCIILLPLDGIMQYSRGTGRCKITVCRWRLQWLTGTEDASLHQLTFNPCNLPLPLTQKWGEVFFKCSSWLSGSEGVRVCRLQSRDMSAYFFLEELSKVIFLLINTQYCIFPCAQSLVLVRPLIGPVHRKGIPMARNRLYYMISIRLCCLHKQDFQFSGIIRPSSAL